MSPARRDGGKRARHGINRMAVAEFRALGYLQEVNRCFLHPLGLALEVVVDEDGSERFGEVWDYRDDPEGMGYGPGMIDTEKAERIRSEYDAKREVREATFGSAVQPVDAEDEAS